MQVELETLTPIWTGDSEGVSATLRETGLIGSLRWWYEGWLRAKGYRVCDPTESPCGYDPETKLEKVCAACRVFGCTGWARLFRLRGERLTPAGWTVATAPEVFTVHRSWLERIYARRDKPKPKVLWGPQFTLTFAPRIMSADGTKADLSGTVAPLLKLIEEYGALGAKTQNGYGVIRIESGVNGGQFRVAGESGKNERGGFDLRRFFALQFAIADPGQYRSARRIGEAKTVYDESVIACAYDIRYKSRTNDWRTGEGESFGLRPFIKTRFGKWAGEQLMGSPARGGERRAGRIGVSHLYRISGEEGYRLRIWGTAPDGMRAEPKEVAEAVEEFICGSGGMFPGSRVTEQALWKDLEARW